MDDSESSSNTRPVSITASQLAMAESLVCKVVENALATAFPYNDLDVKRFGVFAAEAALAGFAILEKVPRV